MERYNYLEAMTADIIEYIRDTYTADEISEKMTDRAEWESDLNDELWTVDRVTGNGSGSYTFSTWTAEENLCHNLDLLAEALREFDDDTNYLKKGAEACDVTIRCYLLYEAIARALDEIEEENA